MKRLLDQVALPLDSTDEKLQYVLDRLAITDVFNRFFLAIDNKDWQAAGECVTDPFTMLVPNNLWGDPTLDGNPVSRAEWVTALELRNTGWYQTLHTHPNELVVIDGDAAHLGSYQVVPHSVGLLPEDTYTSWGFYDVDLKRCGDQWKVERVEIQPRLVENIADIPRIHTRVAATSGEAGWKLRALSGLQWAIAFTTLSRRSRH